MEEENLARVQNKYLTRSTLQYKWGGSREGAGNCHLADGARGKRRYKRARNFKNQQAKTDRAARTQAAWDTRRQAATTALDKLRAAFFANELLIPKELHAAEDAPDLTDEQRMDVQHKTFALIIFYECMLECDYYTPLHVIATRAVANPNVKYVRERTVRDLERTFRAEGTIAVSLRGLWARRMILDNEDLRCKAEKFIRKNAQPKGRPNMRAADFTDYVNDLSGMGLFKDWTEEARERILRECGLQLPITEETGRKWLHRLGATKQAHSKMIYYYGAPCCPCP
jgi:hypothetical protein